MVDSIKIGNRIFDLPNRTYVMGILNVTPDSFSDGGCFDTLDKALFRVEEMQKEGCDIVDIGGESTRPGYSQISITEEIQRVAPVVEAIKARFDIPVSLDTYKYQVAEAGILSGADLINDIWGLRYDEGQMAEVLAKHDVPCCLMHNRKNPEYMDFIPEVFLDLSKSADIALTAGISRGNIILDPGIGFGKTYQHNLEILRSLKEFGVLGYPMLLGASRKSVIGTTLDLPKEEREEGTLVTTIQAVQAGYNFVRVHHVKGNVRAIKMMETILYGQN